MTCFVTYANVFCACFELHLAAAQSIAYFPFGGFTMPVAGRELCNRNILTLCQHYVS
jgi:hypothetical protein